MFIFLFFPFLFVAAFLLDSTLSYNPYTEPSSRLWYPFCISNGTKKHFWMINIFYYRRAFFILTLYFSLIHFISLFSYNLKEDFLYADITAFSIYLYIFFDVNQSPFHTKLFSKSDYEREWKKAKTLYGFLENFTADMIKGIKREKHLHNHNSKYFDLKKQHFITTTHTNVKEIRTNEANITRSVYSKQKQSRQKSTKLNEHSHLSCSVYAM